MVILGGWVFLMSEVPLYSRTLADDKTARLSHSKRGASHVAREAAPYTQGCLAQMKTPYPRTLHEANTCGPVTVLRGGAFSCNRCISVSCRPPLPTKNGARGKSCCARGG